MGCIHSKSKERVSQVYQPPGTQTNRNKNAEYFEDKEKLRAIIDLTDKERELIQHTWWRFREEPYCRLRIMTHYFSANSSIKKKFQRKNEENAANGNLMTAMVSWNIRRFSIRLVEFMDKVVRDLETENYQDIYDISELQGAKHYRLKRMVEPGDMEALGQSIQTTISEHFGEKFNRSHILAWRRLFIVICSRFTLGLVEEEFREDNESVSHDYSLKFPTNDFIDYMDGMIHGDIGWAGRRNNASSS